MPPTSENLPFLSPFSFESECVKYVKTKQNHQYGIYFVTVKSFVTLDNSVEIVRQNEVGGVM